MFRFEAVIVSAVFVIFIAVCIFGPRLIICYIKIVSRNRVDLCFLITVAAVNVVIVSVIHTVVVRSTQYESVVFDQDLFCLRLGKGIRGDGKIAIDLLAFCFREQLLFRRIQTIVSGLKLLEQIFLPPGQFFFGLRKFGKSSFHIADDGFMIPNFGSLFLEVCKVRVKSIHQCFKILGRVLVCNQLVVCSFEHFVSNILFVHCRRIKVILLVLPEERFCLCQILFAAGFNQAGRCFRILDMDPCVSACTQAVIIACHYHFVVGFLIQRIFVGIKERDDVVACFPEDIAGFSVLVGTRRRQLKAVRALLLAFVRLADVKCQTLT